MHKLLLTLFLLKISLCNYSQGRDTIIVHDTVLQVLEDDLPIISIDNDDRNTSDNVASALSASRDVFLNAANFHFNFLQYKLRGLNADVHNVLINGVSMRNLVNGLVPYTLFGGLNDVLRNRDVSMGLGHNTFSFGEVGTSTNIDVRASKQRKQMQLSYALSNRTYAQRVAFTYGSGINKAGWAFSGAMALRHGHKGYMQGTSYQSAGAFIAIDKLFRKHIFSLSAFAARTIAARSSAVTEELISLSGKKNYNPLWGLQSGKERNASNTNTFQPFALFTHEWKPRTSSSLMTSVSFMKGERAVSGLDWYDAPDPRPDNYRYLPSFLTNEKQREELQNEIHEHPELLQINWQRLYDINRNSKETIANANGISGNNISGLRSRYIIQDRVDEISRIAFNTIFNTTLSPSSYLTGGAMFIQQKNNYFKRLNDLLGGDFYVDLDQFAENDLALNAYAAHNDLRITDHVIRRNGRFGYDHIISTDHAAAWVQLVSRSEHIDLFVAGEFDYLSYQREGRMQNGRYPDHSLGFSPRYLFINSKLKAGVTYKLNGRNYVYLNISDMDRPPYVEDLFISPQTRDLVQSEIKNEHIISGEVGYLYRSPKTQIRSTAYHTRSLDGMNVLSFYHDDYRTSVNYALRGINKMYTGIEFYLQHKLIPNVTVSVAGCGGMYIYQGRQKAIITQDNNADILDEELIYTNNYRIGGSPQRIAMIEVSYRSPDYWFISLSGNYAGDRWTDFNPLRRTAKAIDGLSPGDTKYASILDQQRLPDVITADLFAGYSWRLPKKVLSRTAYLIFNTGINNLLNDTGIIRSGYEQLRFDFNKQDISKFPMKYSYAQGLNYFISISFRY